MRRRVLLVFPTSWDDRQLEHLPADLRARYELVRDEPHDDDVRWDLDPERWLEERVHRWRGRLDGVFTTSDYPGALAVAALGSALGLPCSPLTGVLAAAHKELAREIAARVVPEAVPAFAAFDPDRRDTWPTRFPCFVKPVRGSFSLFARRVENEAELATLLTSPALAEYRRYALVLFERFARLGGLARRVDLFLAEELLAGEQVTLEGWVRAGKVETLGIVDTGYHAHARSFARFDLPSALPAPVQARMHALAARLVPALGLDHTLFNLELFHDARSDRLGLIEVNPRPCGQFADLYQKVQGRHSYEIGLALAVGDPLPPARHAPFAAAASVPLRTFRGARVLAVPDGTRLAEVQEEFPGTLAWCECAPGQELRVAEDHEDGFSIRYGILNLGASSRSELLKKSACIERALGFQLEPLPCPPASP